jgi:penicillin-binding protein 1A
LARILLRSLGFLFAGGAVIFLAAVAVAAALLWHVSKDLPDYSQLQVYEPPVMTRVHAADGSLIAEYAHERRLYLPIQSIPKRVTNAFVAAEDQNFYEHGGIDLRGVARAALVYVQNLGSNRRPQGASTITQQVAKNFLLTNELTFARKLKEMVLALRIEGAYSKGRILELYLNEIYLGMGAHGIAAASLVYFGKSVDELTVAEAAYLAALPKAPNNYNPFRRRDRAIARRNYVIERMVEDRYLTSEEGAAAKQAPLTVKAGPPGVQLQAAAYFAEEVRRAISERYGETRLYEGGLSVRTTLDPRLQAIARKALMDQLVRYDESDGWRGPLAHLDTAGDWGASLADPAVVKSYDDVAPWRLAVVLEAGDRAARIGLAPPREPDGSPSRERPTGLLPADGMRFALKPVRGKAAPLVSSVLNPGDVVYVEPMAQDGQFRLRQIPEVSGGIVVMDPVTGRVLALVGGFSYDQSQFNRATQALRQPGSSFKPIVYAAALDNGYTPSSIVMDAPIEIDQGPGLGVWRPNNFEKKFYGPETLRFGVEHSRNVMTVRLTQDLGMPLVTEYARRFGIYDELPPYLSFALGAGETTLMKMTAAYAMFDNGGKRIKPTLIDRIQDRYGRTLYRHGERECRGCDADAWHNQAEPAMVDHREQVLDPLTAYQITSILEGVVQRGTATPLRGLGRPVAGKTGTTSEDKDAWFIGYTPDLVVGVYIGYDKPRHLHGGADGGAEGTGAALAAPVVRDVLKVALAGKPGLQFQVPPGLKLVRVDAKSGLRAGPGSRDVILEAFKPGTGPPEGEMAVGAADHGGMPPGISPDADRAIRSGTGGLY